MLVATISAPCSGFDLEAARGRTGLAVCGGVARGTYVHPFPDVWICSGFGPDAGRIPWSAPQHTGPAWQPPADVVHPVRVVWSFADRAASVDAGTAEYRGLEFSSVRGCSFSVSGGSGYFAGRPTRVSVAGGHPDSGNADVCVVHVCEPAGVCAAADPCHRAGIDFHHDVGDAVSQAWRSGDAPAGACLCVAADSGYVSSVLVVPVRVWRRSAERDKLRSSGSDP